MFGASMSFGMLDGMVRRILQVRPVERGQLHQVAALHESVHLEHVGGLVEPQLGGQHALVYRRHARTDFEPDRRCELAIAKLRLDDLEQVVGLLLVALHDGIARHPNRSQRSISSSGSSRSRLWAMTSSSGTK
jgi:hypothetical protein